jgi:hypothetical protein
MIMIEVQSSCVSKVGYDPDVCVLAIKYHSGQLAVHTQISTVQYAALMAAPSKGRWVAENLRPKGDAAKSDSERGAVASAPQPLAVLDENADRCCRRSMQGLGSRAPHSWVCGQCGTEYRLEVCGPLKLWRRHETFVIHRNGA